MAGTRPGPDPKGGTRLPVRLPEEDRAAYEEAARAAGMSLSDYVAVTMARAHGRRLPAWLAARNSGQQLTLEIPQHAVEAAAA